MNAKNELTVMAQRHIRLNDETIDKFGKLFAENPLNALEWGDAVVTAVAEKGVWSKLIDALARPGTEVDSILNDMAAGALMLASTPEMSSNAMGNVMRRADIAAMARIHRDVKTYLG